MKTTFKKQFEKQIKEVKDQKLKTGILDIILKVENCNSILEIQNLKKLKGYKYFYRIRIGDYRIGVKAENDMVTFSAFHHRKDIYKYFP